MDKKQIGALMAPLARARVANRQQGGRSLSYVEAWDIKAALIRVFGFAGFSAECTDTQVLKIIETGSTTQQGQQRTHYTVLAQCTVRLTIFCDDHDAVFQETAAASQKGPDIGEVTDFAIKTAESDALKRAATYLGTQFGLSLYNNGATEDVVRVLLDPRQSEALDEYRSERMEAEKKRAEEVQAELLRATGAAEPAKQVEEAVQE